MRWDTLANKYDNLWVQRHSLGPTRRELIHRIRALNPRRLLDIGCGTGQLIADLLAVTETECVGIDRSGAMIEAAKAKNLGAAFYTLDISAPLPPELQCGGFDVITCTHSLPYYPNKPDVIRTISELMDEHTTLMVAQASINTRYDAFVMHFVEKTAEKADYLSKAAFLWLTADRLRLVEQFTIRERWFMPSICGFVMKRKDSGS